MARASSSPLTAGVTCRASCLPSSTPHWSKLSMPQTTPWVKVMCSYSAISCPTTEGVSAGAMIEVVGRLPVNTRAGTIDSGGTLGADLVGGLAEGQGRGLGEEVGQEQLVHVVVAVDQRVRRGGDGDEVGRDHLGALVDQLVEGVLPVGARLAPEHLAGLRGDRRAVLADALAVGLHGQLLQVRGEPVQVLRVRQHGVAAGAEEVDVPDVQQAHQGRHVACPARSRRSAVSIAWKPARKSAKFSGPMATATEVPMAESTE